MRHTTLLLFLLLCVIARPVSAQEVPADPTSKQPDQIQQDDPAEEAWHNLRSLVPLRRITPAHVMHAARFSQQPSFQQEVSIAASTNSGANKKDSPDASQVSQQPSRVRLTTPDWQSIAQQCHDFLIQYPNSARAQESRKLKLTAELIATRNSGDSSPEIQSSMAAYLADKTIPEDDRYDISAMSKEARIVLRVGVGMEEITGRRLENARELATEFPSAPRSWASLLNAARRVPLRTAVEVAAQIVSSVEAPDDIKQGAQQLLDKYDMLGKPVSGIDLSSASGKPALLYFWTLKQPPFIEFLKLCAEIEGIALIGINVDEDEQEARQFAARHHPPGGQFYEGSKSPAARRLHVNHFPAMLVLDQNGVLLDYPNTTYGAFDEMKQLAGYPPTTQNAGGASNIAGETK